jgi:hypothetical protein
MAEDAKLASEMALAHGQGMHEALIALFATHPDPAALLAFYEAISNDHADAKPFSQYSDEAMEFADLRRQWLLDVLRGRLKPRAD